MVIFSSLKAIYIKVNSLPKYWIRTDLEGKIVAFFSLANRMKEKILLKILKLR